MVKMEFEINEYLLVFFILSKYLMRCSEAGVQLVLTCLCSAIVLSSFICTEWIVLMILVVVWCTDSSRPTTIKKVKLHPICNPNIFSEIIVLHENGGGGGNQTQIPYFQFYMGIAA